MNLHSKNKSKSKNRSKSLNKRNSNYKKVTSASTYKKHKKILDKKNEISLKKMSI